MTPSIEVSPLPSSRNGRRRRTAAVSARKKWLDGIRAAEEQEAEEDSSSSSSEQLDHVKDEVVKEEVVKEKDDTEPQQPRRRQQRRRPQDSVSGGGGGMNRCVKIELVRSTSAQSQQSYDGDIDIPVHLLDSKLEAANALFGNTFSLLNTASSSGRRGSGSTDPFNVLADHLSALDPFALGEITLRSPTANNPTNKMTTSGGRRVRHGHGGATPTTTTTNNENDIGNGNGEPHGGMSKAGAWCELPAGQQRADKPAQPVSAATTTPDWVKMEPTSGTWRGTVQVAAAAAAKAASGASTEARARTAMAISAVRQLAAAVARTSSLPPREASRKEESQQRARLAQPQAEPSPERRPVPSPTATAVTQRMTGVRHGGKDATMAWAGLGGRDHGIGRACDVLRLSRQNASLDLEQLASQCAFPIQPARGGQQMKVEVVKASKMVLIGKSIGAKLVRTASLLGA